MARAGRGARELRDVVIQRGYTSNPAGSVLIAFGNTRVLCTAVVEDRVPPFLTGKGRGWVTAEYAMLPASAVPRLCSAEHRAGNRDERRTGSPQGTHGPGPARPHTLGP